MGELESSEARLRLALEGAALGTWSHDFATRETHWDARARELFGLSPEAPVDLDVWRAGVHSEDWERVAAVARRALAGRTVVASRPSTGRWGSRMAACCGGLPRGAGSSSTRRGGRCASWAPTWTSPSASWPSSAPRSCRPPRPPSRNALTPGEVGHALVEHGLKSLDAYAGAVSMVEGEQLRLLSQFGYPASFPRDYHFVPLRRVVPSTVAVLGGQHRRVPVLGLLRARVARVQPGRPGQPGPVLVEHAVEGGGAGGGSAGAELLHATPLQRAGARAPGFTRRALRPGPGARPALRGGAAGQGGGAPPRGAGAAVPRDGEPRLAQPPAAYSLGAHAAAPGAALAGSA